MVTVLNLVHNRAAYAIYVFMSKILLAFSEIFILNNLPDFIV
jgi:hypothetical protein